MKGTVQVLKSRVEALQAQSRDLRVEAGALSTQLGEEIAKKIMEMYAKRENRALSFESWLSGKFDNDYSLEDLFDEDPDLKWMRSAARGTDARLMDGVPDTSTVINQHFRAAGHEFGLNRELVSVLPLTGKRLSIHWSGNPPTD